MAYQSFQPVIKEQVEEHRLPLFYNKSQQSVQSTQLLGSKLSPIPSQQAGSYQQSPLTTSFIDETRARSAQFYIKNQFTKSQCPPVECNDTSRRSNHNKQCVTQSYIADPHLDLLNSKSYNLDDSQIRLTAINKRMEELKSKRCLSSPNINVEAKQLKEQVDMLRQALEVKINQYEFSQLLSTMAEMQKERKVDIFAILAQLHMEIEQYKVDKLEMASVMAMNEALKKENCENLEEYRRLEEEYERMNQQTEKQRNKENEQFEQINNLKMEISETKRTMGKYQQECKNYKQLLERQKNHEDSMRELVNMDYGQDMDVYRRQSERKLNEYQNQLTNLMEKSRKDEITIQQLQEKNFKLQLDNDEKQRLQEQIETLNVKSNEYSKQLSDKENYIQELRMRSDKDREYKQQEFKQVFEELSQVRSELRICKDELQWMKNQKIALEDQHEKNMDYLRETETEKITSEQENHQLKELVAQLENEMEELHHKLQATLQHQQELVNDYEQSKKQQQDIQRQLDILRVNIRSAISIADELDDSRVLVDSQNDQQLIEMLEIAFRTLNEQMQNQGILEHKLRQLDEEKSQIIFDLQHKYSDTNQNYENLMEKLKEQESNEQQLVKKIQKIDQQKQTYKNECKHLKQLSTQLKEEMKVQESKFIQNTQRMEMSQFNDLSNENQQLKQQIQILELLMEEQESYSEQFNQKYQEFYQQQQSQIQSLQSENDLLTKIFNKLIGLFNLETSNLISQYIQLLREIASLSSNDRLNTDYFQLQSQLSQVETQIDEQKQSFNQKNDYLTKLDQCHKTISELQFELDMKQKSLQNAQSAYRDLLEDYKRVSKENIVGKANLPLQARKISNHL